MSSNNRWSRLREAFRTQLWPVPLIGVVLAISAGVVMPPVDVAVADVLPAGFSSYLFGGGPGQASEMLSTIAGSLITVTSLTFSLTVVTLQLASAQYSPRLLRTFARDRVVQVTLALFLATFVYALVVLRTVRYSDTPGESFVPRVSVTLAYLLALASVIALVLFLAHLVSEIRVETVMTTVRTDASAVGQQILRELDSASLAGRVPAAPAHAALITARTSGFLSTLDEHDLLAAATEFDAVLVVGRSPGEWIVDGTPMVYAWPHEPGARFDEDRLGELTERVRAAVHTDDERTPLQDLAYGLRQLTDVAVKALSPGINDPTTAVHALGHSATLLCELVQQPLGSTVLRSDDDVVRLIVTRPDLEELLELALTQPRLYGAQDPVVLEAMFTFLRDVAWRLKRPEDQAAITAQLADLRTTVDEQNLRPATRERLADAGLAVEAALRRTWMRSP